MKENNVDGRKAAQPREGIQPGWLGHFHRLSDASGEKTDYRLQMTDCSKEPDMGHRKSRADST
jgi:hypothetical protein